MRNCVLSLSETFDRLEDTNKVPSNCLRIKYDGIFLMKNESRGEEKVNPDNVTTKE
jgi:hypothetical protein